VIFSEIGNTLHCSFSERLDESVCSVLEQELQRRTTEFKNNHEDARLVFDLSEAVFISSVFLRVCLIYLKSFGKDCFTIMKVSEDIYRVFYVSGFTEIMNVIPSDPVTPPPRRMGGERTE
jgi:anti-anti-sigma regulatory factor